MIARSILFQIVLILITLPTTISLLAGQTPVQPAQTQMSRPPDVSRAPELGQFQERVRDFDRMSQQQADTDKTWRTASEGYMQMEKITYRSRAADLDIPAFVFQPLQLRSSSSASRA